MALEDDIARIAAIRGRRPEDYAAGPPRRPIQRDACDRILVANPSPSRDLDFYDQLPEKSRAFIRNHDAWPLNAMWWWYTLRDTGQDEDELIKAVTFCLPPPRRPTT